ncbi:MAG: hypothetical protein VX438_02630, partial [Planctomycetota bacterium]|nr:hypothetical protein [Planctomycetota bacterium]
MQTLPCHTQSIHCLLVLCLSATLPLTPSYTQDGASRAKAMTVAQIQFQPSVFSENEFPQCDFVDRQQSTALLGNYRIQTHFYGSDYREVKQPSRAGRYGAVIKIHAEDGKTYTRFRTLYKTPYRLKPFPGLVKGQMSIPLVSGIKPEVWKNQNTAISDYLTNA